MDSFEWNKVAGWVLATVLVIVGLNILVGKMMEPEKAKGPGMEVVVTETPNGNGGTPAVEAKPDWGTVLASADLAAGEKTHQRCLQCHDFSKGGPNKIGPNLYGILGSKHAHLGAAFSYSPAMMALADKTWGYDELNDFIANPKAVMPGTKMSFPGLSKVQDRVNLIAYLRTVSDAPLPIPPPNPAEPPAGQVQNPPPSGAAPASATPAGGEPAATPAAAGTPAAPSATPAPGATAPAATPATPPAPATPAPATPPSH